ncbi:MAG: PPC domain-containing protein, partial [Halobacteriales archaeon]|nr:PPC domain-containing protein [Halobacteriales archaeon]
MSLPLGLLVIIPAFTALAFVGYTAWRRPILARMALRNLQRRRTQALAIALGLVIGTAIIAGSLAIGDSSTAALRDLAIGSFGPVDETVGLDGSLAFPQEAATRLAQDAGVRAASDAVEPALLTDAALAHPAAGQFEPRATLIGLDPDQDRAMGPFRTAQGTSMLAGMSERDIVLNQQLAGKVHAQAGDTVTVRYAKRPEPWVPKVFFHNGTLGVGAGLPIELPGLPGPVPHPPPPYSPSTPVDNATFGFSVDAGARRVTAALFWTSLNNRTDMDLALDAPDGTELWNANGTYTAPDTPAILNATAQPGQWTARVVSKAAVEQRFTLVILVFYEVHDLATIQQFIDQVHSDPRAASFVENLTGPLSVEQREFTVRFVASQEGRGGFLQQPDAWVRLDVLQGMLDKQGRVNLVLVSNPGDAEQGLQGTDRALGALRAGIASLPNSDHGLEGLAPRPVKQEFLSDAERASTLFTSFLGMMGSFSVLAGLILIVNTFVQLAEERRTELGIARA